MLEDEKLVVEGAGAVTFGAILAGCFPNLRGKRWANSLLYMSRYKDYLWSNGAEFYCNLFNVACKIMIIQIYLTHLWKCKFIFLNLKKTF